MDLRAGENLPNESYGLSDCSPMDMQLIDILDKVCEAKINNSSQEDIESLIVELAKDLISYINCKAESCLRHLIYPEHYETEDEISFQRQFSQMSMNEDNSDSENSNTPSTSDTKSSHTSSSGDSKATSSSGDRNTSSVGMNRLGSHREFGGGDADRTYTESEMWAEEFFIPLFSEFAIQTETATNLFTNLFFILWGGRATPTKVETFVNSFALRFEAKLGAIRRKALKNAGTAVWQQKHSLTEQTVISFRKTLHFYATRLKNYWQQREKKISYWKRFVKQVLAAADYRIENKPLPLVFFKIMKGIPESNILKPYSSEDICREDLWREHGLTESCVVELPNTTWLWPRFHGAWRQSFMYSTYCQVQKFLESFPDWIENRRSSLSKRDLRRRYEQLHYLIESWEIVCSQERNDSEDEKLQKFKAVFQNLIRIEILGGFPDDMQGSSKSDRTKSSLQEQKGKLQSKHHSETIYTGKKSTGNITKSSNSIERVAAGKSTKVSSVVKPKIVTVANGTKVSKSIKQSDKHPKKTVSTRTSEVPKTPFK